MKKIEAIIRRTKFDDVKEALLKADIEWFSYYDRYRMVFLLRCERGREDTRGTHIPRSGI